VGIGENVVKCKRRSTLVLVRFNVSTNRWSFLRYHLLSCSRVVVILDDIIIKSQFYFVLIENDQEEKIFFNSNKENLLY